jgi:hypothetical protein
MVCVFFLSILSCSYIGNHPQEGLAKFGYRSKRKVENNKNCAIFWWLARTYCLNMVISEFFFLPLNLATLVHFFFSQKSFVWVTLDLFLSSSGKIHPKKKSWLKEPNQIYTKLIIARKLKLVGNHSLEIFFQYFSIIVNGRKLCEYWTKIREDI